MAQPSLADVHADQPLTDFSSAAFLDPGVFKWREFAPLKPVDKQSNKYYTFDRGDFFRTEAKLRAPGTKAALRDFKLSSDTYYCDRYAVAHAISEMELAQADPGIDLEESTAAVLAQDLNIRAEINAATAYLNTASVWGTDASPATVWSDAASDPIGELTTGIKTIQKAIGRRPNTLLLGADVFYDGLVNHPDILARLADNEARLIDEAFIGRLLKVPKVIVMAAPYTSSQEGLTDTFAFIGGKHAVLAYVDPAPGLKTPTAAVTFSWAGLLGAAASGIRTKRMMLPETDALPLIESDTCLDFKVVSSVAGYRIASCVT